MRVTFTIFKHEKSCRQWNNQLNNVIGNNTIYIDIYY
jgi:hypothetical protein